MLSLHQWRTETSAHKCQRDDCHKVLFHLSSYIHGKVDHWMINCVFVLIFLFTTEWFFHLIECSQCCHKLHVCNILFVHSVCSIILEKWKFWCTVVYMSMHLCWCWCTVLCNAVKSAKFGFGWLLCLDGSVASWQCWWISATCGSKVHCALRLALCALSVVQNGIYIICLHSLVMAKHFIE